PKSGLASATGSRRKRMVMVRGRRVIVSPPAPGCHAPGYDHEGMFGKSLCAAAGWTPAAAIRMNAVPSAARNVRNLGDIRTLTERPAGPTSGRAKARAEPVDASYPIGSAERSPRAG